MLHSSSPSLFAFLTLALFTLVPQITAQAPSQSKIAACQASITIPSYQDYYYYDVNDASAFTVTYQYDGVRESSNRSCLASEKADGY